MSAETNCYLHLYANDTSFDIGLASIDTKINDVSLRETELEVFWDGKIALFSDDSNNEMDMNKSTILSTSSIEYYFGDDGVPIGYTIQYPVKIYQIDVTDSKTGEISIPDDDGYSLNTVVMEASDVLGNFEEECIVENDNTIYNTWTPAQSNNTMDATNVSGRINDATGKHVRNWYDRWCNVNIRYNTNGYGK